jgi:hypothetical protein
MWKCCPFQACGFSLVLFAIVTFSYLMVLKLQPRYKLMRRLPVEEVDTKPTDLHDLRAYLHDDKSPMMIHSNQMGKNRV